MNNVRKKTKSELDKEFREKNKRDYLCECGTTIQIIGENGDFAIQAHKETNKHKQLMGLIPKPAYMVDTYL